MFEVSNSFVTKEFVYQQICITLIKSNSKYVYYSDITTTTKKDIS